MNIYILPKQVTRKHCSSVSLDVQGRQYGFTECFQFLSQVRVFYRKAGYACCMNEKGICLSLESSLKTSLISTHQANMKYLECENAKKNPKNALCASTTYNV